MTDFIESMGLHSEGFTDAQIDQINAAVPDAQALIAALKTELPRINRLLPVIQMVFTVFEQHQKETS